MNAVISKILHISISLLAAILIVGVPYCVCFGVFSGGGVDAVSQASIVVPDQPSGEYIVLINTSLHEDTIEDWKLFFDDEYAVIFDDINCIAPIGDTGAQQLAERFMLQLPENQMTLKSEDLTLLVSKAECGAIDAAVFSKEAADALKLTPPDGMTVINVTGE